MNGRQEREAELLPADHRRPKGSQGLFGVLLKFTKLQTLNSGLKGNPPGLPPFRGAPSDPRK